MAQAMFRRGLTIIFGLLLATAATAGEWQATATIEAPEAVQAAAADAKFLYAIDNHRVARYDRQTGKKVAESTGEAKHLNSGFLHEGKLLCAHSNYPRKPEQSEVFALDLETMKLAVLHDFGNYGGSLTWCVRHDGHWWCNFALYGKENAKTFLVKLDDQWREQARYTYPSEVTSKLGTYSISGGIFRDGALLVTDHDHGLLYELHLPREGNVLELATTHKVPFTGQGIAHDPVTGGLVGISRARRQIVLAAPKPQEE